MLRTFRENIKGRAGKVVLAIIIVPFVFFGAESMLTGSGGAEVLSINGETVDEQLIAQERLIVRNELLSKMGADIDFEQLDEARLTPVAIDRLTQSILLQQLAQRQNMSVPQSMLERVIVGLPVFQVDGKFSSQQLEMVLAESGMNLNYLKTRLADDVRAAQISNGIAQSSFVIDAEVDLLIDIATESRTVRWAKLPYENIKNSIDVTEQELQAYYETSKEDYMAPMQVQVEYVELNMKNFYEPVSESVLQQEYSRQSQQFEATDEREIAHILLEIGDGQSKKQARQIFADIRQKYAAGESFAELAKTYSQDIGSAAEGGSLGYSQQDGMFPEAFETAAFSIALGELSEIVETDAGMHLITVTDIKIAEFPEFEEMRETLQSQIEQREAKKRYVLAVEQLADMAFNAPDLAGPASELGLQVKLQNGVSREGVLEQAASEYWADTRILNALYSDEVLTGGLNTEVIEVDAQKSVVLRVKELIEPRQKSFEEVERVIRDRLLVEKTANQLEKITAQLQALADEGESFDKLLEQRGYEASSMQTFTRQSTELAPQILDAIFTAPRQGAGNTVYNAALGADYYLFQLLEVTQPSEAVAAASADIFGQQINALSIQQQGAAYMKTMQQTATIERF